MADTMIRYRRSKRIADTKKHKKRLWNIATYCYGAPYIAHRGFVKVMTLSGKRGFIKRQSDKRFRNMPIPAEEEWDNTPRHKRNDRVKLYDYWWTLY